MRRKNSCYLIRGLPGTGKTTLSNILFDLIHNEKKEALNTDKIRKEDPPEFDKKQELYSEENKERVYKKLYEKLEEYLGSGFDVIVDAVFDKKERILKIRDTCGSYQFKVIECICNEEVVRKRIKKRQEQGKSYSDADFEVYKKLEKTFEHIEDEGILYFRINTEKDKEELKQILKDIIGE